MFKLKFNYNWIKTSHPLEGIFLSSIVVIVFNITYQEGGDRVFLPVWRQGGSGMLGISFDLALIETLDLIE